MIAIQLSNITLVLGARPIFKNLTWSIQHDQKIGLIGPNGAGKSSLFKLMVGEYTPEAGGSVVRAKGLRLGYLPQEPELPPQQTVFAAALDGRAFPEPLIGEYRGTVVIVSHGRSLLGAVVTQMVEI